VTNRRGVELALEELGGDGGEAWVCAGTYRHPLSPLLPSIHFPLFHRPFPLPPPALAIGTSWCTPRTILRSLSSISLRTRATTTTTTIYCALNVPPPFYVSKLPPYPSGRCWHLFRRFRFAPTYPLTSRLAGPSNTGHFSTPTSSRYRAPTPSQRSRTNSPGLIVRSVSAPQVPVEVSISDDGMSDDEEPAQSVYLTDLQHDDGGQWSAGPFPPFDNEATISPPHPNVSEAQRAVERTQDQIIRETDRILRDEDFTGRLHAAQTTGTPLFPGNTIIGEHAPSQRLLDAHSTTPAFSPIHFGPLDDGKLRQVQVDLIADAINSLTHGNDKLHKLFSHSVGQNNVLGSFMATMTDALEKRLQSIETTLKEALSSPRESVKPKGPSTPSASSEKLDLIARKVTSLEHKVSTPSVAGNPPGPSPTPPKQQSRRSAAPSPPSSRPWYEVSLTTLNKHSIVFWAYIINVGKWGALKDGKPECLAMSADEHIDDIRAFIHRAAVWHNTPGQGSMTFINPPPSPPERSQGWTKKFSWETLRWDGEVADQKTEVFFAPGFNASSPVSALRPKGKGKANDPGTTTPSPAPSPPTEQPWINTPKGGGKPKSFAHAASLPAAPLVKPQKAYQGVPTSRFMSPAPKPQRRSGGFVIRYIIRFHNDEKPTKGTAAPAQFLTSEINRVSNSFNIRANSVEWTSAMNLLIFFTHDSADPQITKAGNTIMGTIARGCGKSIFMKSVKWSWIVVRNVPTTKWVSDPDNSPMAHMITSDDDPLATLPHGRFEDVTLEDLETELRKAHPLLETALFMEGPSWTCRDGKPPPGATTTNVSFAVPDPDESRLKALTKRPILLFHLPVFCTAWTEKVNLTQCPRCWKYGDKVHPDCPARCRVCGGGHSEELHNSSCKKCTSSNLNQEDVVAGKTICSHAPLCPNCSEPHHADDNACRMRNHAACEARLRKKVGRGQTFISTFSDAQLARQGGAPSSS
jgi:hypothetical protein